jgi:hypothetical protein
MGDIREACGATDAGEEGGYCGAVRDAGEPQDGTGVDVHNTASKA